MKWDDAIALEVGPLVPGIHSEIVCLAICISRGSSTLSPLSDSNLDCLVSFLGPDGCQCLKLWDPMAQKALDPQDGVYIKSECKGNWLISFY